MTQTILSYLLPFLLGAGIMYAVQRPPDLPEPETKTISLATYERMFAQPELFRNPHLERVYIVSERVETVTDTVKIPISHIDRRDDLRLSYGDITIESDRVRLGVFNPGTSTWEVQDFSVPEPTWRRGFEIFAGWPVQSELSYTVWHRSGLFARARGGFVTFPDEALVFGVGLGYRF